jgi:hypothetical protein
MAKQKTKMEKFNEILVQYNLTAEHRELIENEIALLAKASSNRKPTATQVENENLMVYIESEFERLADSGFISQAEFHKATTITEIKELTPQKLSPLLNKLVAKDVLIKTKVKNVSKYMLKSE